MKKVDNRMLLTKKFGSMIDLL